MRDQSKRNLNLTAMYAISAMAIKIQSNPENRKSLPKPKLGRDFQTQYSSSSYLLAQID